MKKVSMIGLGKLGLDCAEVMAKHYDVTGYDILPVKSKKIKIVKDLKDAVLNQDIIFIAVPTPHDVEYGGERPVSHLEPKDFNYDIVIETLTKINLYSKKNQLIVLISTVLPGTIRNILKPKDLNFRFIYNPYLIAMGTVKKDMVDPEMIIIGSEDGKKTKDALELINFYKPIVKNKTRYEIGTWDEAESIKIFYNTFISTKIALVNMIQDVAEKNSNINVDVVTNALAKSTYRITGPAYMKAGMGDGGACHPRDNIALRYLSKTLNLGYDIFDSVTKSREIQAKNLAEKCLLYGSNICIIGKSYKPKVPYVHGSYSLLVADFIESLGGKVSFYDKNTSDIDINDIQNSDVILIGYWENWVKELFVKKIVNTSKIVIDPWREITKDQFLGKIIHYGNTRN